MNSGTTPEHVLRAYEFGSRCTFLFWDLVDKGRFGEELTSSFYPLSVSKVQSLKSFNFQFSFNHGLMNSLGISKVPDEQFIHLGALIETTKSSNADELCKWIRAQKIQYEWFLPT